MYNHDLARVRIATLALEVAALTKARDTTPERTAKHKLVTRQLQRATLAHARWREELHAAYDKMIPTDADIARAARLYSKVDLNADPVVRVRIRKALRTKRLNRLLWLCGEALKAGAAPATVARVRRDIEQVIADLSLIHI